MFSSLFIQQYHDSMYFVREIIIFICSRKGLWFEMINCSKCQSDNVQKLSLAYESGLSDVNTKTNGFSFGGAGLNFGGARTKGTSQTALSMRAAPPRKYSYIKPVLIGLLASVIVEIWLSTTLLTNAVLVVTSGGLLYRSFLYNRNQWPALHNSWRNSFICHKCGAIYEVN